MNNTGYQNLMRLSTIANLEGFYYQPRVDHDLLEKYNEGIIAMSACMGGEIGEAITSNRDEEALKIAEWYKQVFGDRFYLEVQDHGHPKNPYSIKNKKWLTIKLLEIGKKLDIPIVVTCDAHYLKKEDQEAHEVLLCVGTVSFLNDPKRMSLKDYPLHVEDPQNIIDRWGKESPRIYYQHIKSSQSMQCRIRTWQNFNTKVSRARWRDRKKLFRKNGLPGSGLSLWCDSL